MESAAADRAIAQDEARFPKSRDEKETSHLAKLFCGQRRA